MKISKKVNSATNSCGIPAKPSNKVEQSTTDRYLYLTKHGIGPGTLPKGVKLLDSKDLSNELTAIWLDRFLTTEELEDYDIYPETGIDDVLTKYGIDETYDSLSSVTSATYDRTPETVNEQYIARLMENVDSKLPDTFVTYKYDLGDNAINCTSASPVQIAEYNVPVDDLSGNLDDDTDYILGAIQQDDDYSEEDELVQDGRYVYKDHKSVLDNGFITDYTMYYDTLEDKYVFVFGDRDLYSPYDENFDWECDTEEEAYEWFDSYEGTDSDDDYFDYSDVGELELFD